MRLYRKEACLSKEIDESLTEIDESLTEIDESHKQINNDRSEFLLIFSALSLLLDRCVYQIVIIYNISPKLHKFCRAECRRR